MTADELRAYVEQGPTVVLWPAKEILRLMDERDSWKRAADEMAETACMEMTIETLAACTAIIDIYRRATQSAGVASAADAAPDCATGLPPCNNLPAASNGGGPLEGEGA